MKVTVIGGANLDIHGIPESHLIHQTSNPGTIHYSCGGVGRNIAENLARLHVPVSLITCLGDDWAGNMILQNAKTNGIELTDALVIPKARTSTYLSIQNEFHEMQLAISDMKILNCLTSEVLAPLMDRINQSNLVVLDTNLDESLLAWLFHEIHCPIYLDPISVTKSHKIVPYLTKIHTLKPNRYEAEELVGFPLITQQDVERAGEFLLSQGVQRVVITLGEEGAYVRQKDGAYFLKITPQIIQSATGAGDAFMAGVIYQSLQQAPLPSLLQFASACSSITLSSLATVAENMSVEEVQRVMSTMDEKEVTLQ